MFGSATCHILFHFCRKLHRRFDIALPFELHPIVIADSAFKLHIPPGSGLRLA